MPSQLMTPASWTDLVVAPGISYTAPRYINNNLPTVTFPLPTSGSAGFVGGSFLVAPLPDPVGVALLPALLILRLRRRRSQRRMPAREDDGTWSRSRARRRVRAWCQQPHPRTRRESRCSSVGSSFHFGLKERDHKNKRDAPVALVRRVVVVARRR